MANPRNRNNVASTPHQLLEQAAQLINSGKTNQAATKLKKLLLADPNMGAAHALMSQINIQQKNADTALMHAAKAYQLSPSANTRRQYGVLLFATAQFELAEQILLELIKVDPEDIKGLRVLRLLYANKASANLDQELTTLLILKTLCPLTEPEKERIYLLLNRNIKVEFTPQFINHLKDLLDYPGANYRCMSPVLCGYVIQKYGLDAPEPQLEMASIAQDRLLIQALPKIIFASSKIEEFITALRKAILQTTLEQQALNPELLPLTQAICLQNHLNEYVHSLHDDEQQMLTLALELLVLQSNQPGWLPAGSEALLLVTSMYQPLLDLPFSQKLLGTAPQDWPESLQIIARETLFNPDRELTEMLQIPSLTAISNAVSQEVQQHYEQHPYPRWLTSGLNPLSSINAMLMSCISDFKGSDALKKPDTPILIAGCGTGQQAIRAAQRFPQARVTAVDISRRSLAYARNKARELGIETIDFYQGDILELPQTGLRFHYIECTGVLHHMQDPMQGWRALEQILEPGGVMYIALYSAKARRHITAERDKIAALALQPTLENIRNYRQVMLQKAQPSTVTHRFSDFYTLNECRDLLFHRHECCFDWQQIGSGCATLGLTFLGLFGQQTPIEECQKTLNGVLNSDNTEHLHALEFIDPDLFGGMCSFLCQKPG